MPKLKTNKTISKRFRITKNGKVLKRREGQDHFNAGKTGNNRRRKRRDLMLSSVHKAALKAGLPRVAIFTKPKSQADTSSVDS